ncbi:MAG: class A beta-lactamase [Thermoanaerobaculia bacterium]
MNPRTRRSIVCALAALVLAPAIPAAVEPVPVEVLRDRLEQIAKHAEGRVGVAATVVESGETVTLRATDRFPMQSVYKLPIAMAALAAVEQGKLALDARIEIGADDLVPAKVHSPFRDQHPKGGEATLEELLRLALVESDSTASDVLLRLLGGPAAANAAVAALGGSGFVIATTEKEMARGEDVQYRNWATPTGIGQLLVAIQTGKVLSDANRARLVAWMTASKPGAKRLRGLLPPEAAVAHKTGTSPTQNGLTRATNDVGIVTLPNGKHLAIAVFVADSTADEATREAVIARIADAAWRFFGPSWR